MTKSELAILARVKEVNDGGGLAGGGASPTAQAFTQKECRFYRRLYEAGKIVWVDWTPKLGSGWAIADHAIMKQVEPAKDSRIMVDRKLFMNWTSGVLLERDAKGTCYVTDDTQVEKKFSDAVKAMENGETIYLTQAGKVITSMRLTSGGFEESLVK